MVLLFILAVARDRGRDRLSSSSSTVASFVQDDGGLLARPDMSLVALPARGRCSRPVVVARHDRHLEPRRTVSLAAAAARSRSSWAARASTADTTDPLERRLLNVVEEMAIASGVPVPQVYVLEREAGINAFAAGYTGERRDRGDARRLEKLNRDELQGVIAHEFSHVLNGDMRLNMRLIGVLFGLTVIAMVARTSCAGAARRRRPQGRGRRRRRPARGVVVLALGWVGLFSAG